MVNRCYLCTNVSTIKTEKPVSFHSFPTEPAVRFSWFELFEFDPYQNVKNIKICSEHFVEDDFEISLASGRRILKRTSVPSVNLTKRKSRYSTLPVSKTPAKTVVPVQTEQIVQFVPDTMKDTSEVITIEVNRNDIGNIVEVQEEGHVQGEYMEVFEEEDGEESVEENVEYVCCNETCRNLLLEKEKHIFILRERNMRLEKRIETLTNLLSNLKS